MSWLLAKRKIVRGIVETNEAKTNRRLDKKAAHILNLIEKDQANFFNLRILDSKTFLEHLFKDDAKLFKEILNKIHEKHFKEDENPIKYHRLMQLIYFYMYWHIRKNEEIKNQLKDNPELNKRLFAEWGDVSVTAQNVNYDIFDTHNVNDSSSFANALSLFRRTAIVLGFDGVTLGFSESGNDKLAVPIGNDTYNISISGSAPRPSVQWLTKYLRDYIQIHGSDSSKSQEIAHFQKVTEAMTFFTRHYGKAGSSKTFYDRCKKGELTYMTSGCNDPPHAVGVAIQGEYLIYCNRGYGLLDEHAGTKIYKLNGPIDAETIRKIIRAFNNSKSTIEDLHETLNRVVDLASPIASLPSKSQEHGNCAFANPKATIEGMLVLLQNGKGDEQNIRKIVNASDKTYEKSYKNLTKHIRDANVNEIIIAAHMASTPQTQQFLLKLIKECIIRGGMAKTRTELKTMGNANRLLHLWEGIPDKMRNDLINDNDIQQFMKRAEGVKFSIVTNQKFTQERLDNMSLSEIHNILNHAIKWDRVDIIKSLLNSDAIHDYEAKNQYLQTAITARLICDNEFIENYVDKAIEKYDTPEEGIKTLLRRIEILSRPPKEIDQMVAGIEKVISLVNDKGYANSIEVKELLDKVSANLNHTPLAQSAELPKKPPIGLAVSSLESQPMIREMYNHERNASLTKRGLLSYFARNTEQNSGILKENPARTQQIDALQKLVDSANTASSEEKGKRHLELYCALRYMDEMIKNEKNKLPSALAKVCKSLISRIENDGALNKEIMKAYCQKTNLPFNDTMTISHIQNNHLNEMAEAVLNTKNDQSKVKAERSISPGH
ncbi:hypothetical protein [Candidatus Berkiella aquae]|uniref:Uncharacterized protein n=1 Tax=Candidatus Berkiella aquae TaxID=295108 RepID=A0A0Q9YXD6_9GAMM|nr:hypothetical protein [Candidatus Berkiella aquae]MCS5710951.1 hypothetical protein [Candidatus Berkiella aquae]